MYNNVFVQIFIIFINFFYQFLLISGSINMIIMILKRIVSLLSYIFGIVWFVNIFYLVLSIIELCIDRMTIPLKKMLINQSVTEVALQIGYLLK